jgi:hypothetical protein
MLHVRDEFWVIPHGGCTGARKVQLYNLRDLPRPWCHDDYPIPQKDRLRDAVGDEENRGLFRRFEIPRPYQTLDDIFCYRFKRTVDPYCKVSWAALKFSLSGVPIRDEVELRISFNLKTRLALIRFWYQDKLVGQRQVKAEDLKKVHF